MDFQQIAHEYRWIVLAVVAVVLFVIDLYGHREHKGKAHEVYMKEAILWSLFWVGAGLLFGGYVWFAEGRDSVSRYYASFVLEKGMSVDNIAVWLTILTGLAISKDKWHKLLTWGVGGAILFRGVFIFGGINLIHRFAFLEIILGLFLLTGAFKIIGLRMKLKPFKIYMADGSEEFDPEKDHSVRLAKWTFSKINLHLDTASVTFGIALLTIELTDIVFALDSLPVVISLNDSMFVAASSNLFAIFGLRALFFVISGFLSKLEYLKYGLGGILLFISAKMIFSLDISPLISLIVISVILALATVISLMHKTETDPR